jgi:hypothetical protein
LERFTGEIKSFNAMLERVPRSRCTKAAARDACVDGEAEPRNPTVGSFACCCALAASGHALAPPSSVMNSRRLN